eukprot:gene3871-15169_t
MPKYYMICHIYYDVRLIFFVEKDINDKTRNLSIILRREKAKESKLPKRGSGVEGGKRVILTYEMANFMEEDILSSPESITDSDMEEMEEHYNPDIIRIANCNAKRQAASAPGNRERHTQHLQRRPRRQHQKVCLGLQEPGRQCELEHRHCHQEMNSSGKVRLDLQEAVVRHDAFSCTVIKNDNRKKLWLRLQEAVVDMTLEHGTVIKNDNQEKDALNFRKPVVRTWALESMHCHQEDNQGKVRLDSGSRGRHTTRSMALHQNDNQEPGRHDTQHGTVIKNDKQINNVKTEKEPW